MSLAPACCDNCRWCRHHPVDPKVKEYIESKGKTYRPSGDCRRYPPQMIGDRFDHDALWPVVYLDDGPCGEWIRTSVTHLNVKDESKEN